MRTAAGLAGALVALLASACSEPLSARGDGDRSTVTTAPTAPSSPTAALPSGSASTEPVPEEQEREPRRSSLSLPSIGLRDVPVVRYRGAPDDGAGTAIQNRGPMASPRGPGGGVGPGEVGNFIVTGHRTSHWAPFAELPAVHPGDRVRVESAGVVHVYEITRTRSTSFRSPVSLARQSAPVPGRPGVRPTRAMITLSTCATPEDHARGNYWSDRFGNPEHRIDKVGVLVATRPAR
jgi:sortase A